MMNYRPNLESETNVNYYWIGRYKSQQTCKEIILCL